MRSAVTGLVVAGLASLLTAVPADAGGDNRILFYVEVDAERGGEVLCGLYDDEERWLGDDVVAKARAEVHASWVTCAFEGIPSGRYAIAALHDEDRDGAMDKNVLGIPLEGYAASRDAHLHVLVPAWEDASFTVRTGHSAQRAHTRY